MHPGTQYPPGHWQHFAGRTPDPCRPGDHLAHLLCTGRGGAVRYRAAVPCAAGPDAGSQRTGPRHPGADAGTAFSGAGPLTPKAQTLLFPEWCLCFLYARTSNPAKRNLMSAIKIFEHFYHKKFINVAILPHTTYYFNFVRCNEIYKFHNAIYT